MTMLTSVDRAIVNRLQNGLPVVDRPFADVARELGISESLLLSRIEEMLEDGILSRFGPMYHAERLGGAFCLAALRVPRRRYDEIARIVNEFDEVAHNYRREHDLNMWFVIATDEPDRVGQVIREIEAATGLEVLDFPKLDEYYVRLHLEA